VPVLAAALHQRVVYAESVAKGLSVVEGCAVERKARTRDRGACRRDPRRNEEEKPREPEVRPVHRSPKALPEPKVRRAAGAARPTSSTPIPTSG